jgi:hypothetical protein
MDHLAPAAVVFAPRLHAAVGRALLRQEAVVETVSIWRMRLAPAHIENLAQDIGVRLTARAVGAGDGGLLGEEVRHVRGL